MRTTLSRVPSEKLNILVRSLNVLYETLMNQRMQTAVDPTVLAIVLQEDTKMANRNARLQVIDYIQRGGTVVLVPLQTTKDLTTKQRWALYTMAKGGAGKLMAEAYREAENHWLSTGEITKRDTLTPEEKQLVKQLGNMKAARRNLIAKAARIGQEV